MVPEALHRRTAFEHLATLIRTVAVAHMEFTRARDAARDGAVVPAGLDADHDAGWLRVHFDFLWTWLLGFVLPLARVVFVALCTKCVLHIIDKIDLTRWLTRIQQIQ